MWMMSPLPAPDLEEQALSALDRGERARVITLLMRGYGADIYRHCRLVCGDRDLADEVHQTVFVQAFRDLGTFSRRSSFRTWLLAIARHRCFDALKISRRWRRRFTLSRKLPDAPDPRASSEAEVELAGAQVALAAALAKLPANARSAVLLRYQEGLSFEEMAEICGERATTLQARVARALPVLRKMMVKHER
jgi:RNA polymerase sigma-70 factor (ECF subfamily)